MGYTGRPGKVAHGGMRRITSARAAESDSAPEDDGRVLPELGDPSPAPAPGGR